MVKPHEVAKVVEVVNPEIVSIESNNDGKLIRPDGSNDKISFKKPVQKLEGKGRKKKKVNFTSRGRQKKNQIVRVIMRNQRNPVKGPHKDY